MYFFITILLKWLRSVSLLGPQLLKESTTNMRGFACCAQPLSTFTLMQGPQQNIFFSGDLLQVKEECELFYEHYHRFFKKSEAGRKSALL